MGRNGLERKREFRRESSYRKVKRNGRGHGKGKKEGKGELKKMGRKGKGKR